jgi:hypothetical protein
MTLTLTTFRVVGDHNTLYCPRHAAEAMTKEAGTTHHATEISVSGADAATGVACAVCKAPVGSGQTFFTVGESRIHEACFRCASCRASLESYFAGPSGSLVCPSCYFREEKLSGQCGKCGKAVGEREDGVAAVGKVWHRACLVCAHSGCARPISQQCIEGPGGAPFCSEACLNAAAAKSGPQCARCAKSISDAQHLQVGSLCYHSACFVCARANCAKPLAGEDFYDVDGQFLCHACATS